MSLWTYIHTAEQNKQVYDTFTVSILDEKGAVLATPLRLSNLDASRGYVQRTVDMSLYAGPTVTIQLRSQEDNRLATTS